MRKKILLMLSVFCFMGATVFGQAIEGGAGIIHVDGDPNMNTSLNTVTVNEGNIAYDKDNQIVYYYDPLGTNTDGVTPGLGTHWIAVDVSNLVDPITSIIVDAAGSPELTASTTAGVTTLSFESDAAMTFVGTTLTFTDVDGDAAGSVDFSLIADLVDVQEADPSITVAGNGTAATPYLISLTGANGATAGTVPVTDGLTGALTWTEVIESITVDAEGRVMVKPTTGPAVALGLDDIPVVANMTDVADQLALIGAGESALLKAATNNTFGMPATSGFGVLFVIEK